MINLLCTNFLGSWNLERHIDDFFDGKTGFFKGQVTISDCCKKWLYSETGLLTIESQVPLKSERKYLWSPNSCGFDIYFDNNKFFHKFKIPKNLSIDKSSAARYDCYPDHYRVTYLLHSSSAWESVWHVKGPRKFYRIRSKYKRSDPKEMDFCIDL